jgi:hypothetical protein
MAKGTIFVEFKEEVLPKCIPAVIDSIWYPPKDEEEDVTPDEDAQPGE